MTPKSHIFEYLILGWWSYCRRIRRCNLVGRGLPLGFFPCLFFFVTVLDILSQMWDLSYCSRIMSVCLLLPQPWWSFLWNLKPPNKLFLLWVTLVMVCYYTNRKVSKTFPWTSITPLQLKHLSGLLLLCLNTQWFAI